MLISPVPTLSRKCSHFNLADLLPVDVRTGVTLSLIGINSDFSTQKLDFQNFLLITASGASYTRNKDKDRVISQ